MLFKTTAGGKSRVQEFAISLNPGDGSSENPKV